MKDMTGQKHYLEVYNKTFFFLQIIVMNMAKLCRRN